MDFFEESKELKFCINTLLIYTKLNETSKTDIINAINAYIKSLDLTPLNITDDNLTNILHLCIKAKYYQYNNMESSLEDVKNKIKRI